MNNKTVYTHKLALLTLYLNNFYLGFTSLFKQSLEIMLQNRVGLESTLHFGQNIRPSLHAVDAMLRCELYPHG